jgi:hypothetical protein
MIQVFTPSLESQEKTSFEINLKLQADSLWQFKTQTSILAVEFFPMRISLIKYYEGYFQNVPY